MRGQGLAYLGLRLAAGGAARRVCACGKKKTGKCPYSALRICFVSRDAFSHAACFRLVSFDDAAAAVRRTVFLHVTVATRLARGALRRRAAVCFLRSRVSACLLGRLVLCRHVCRFGGPTSFERQPLDCCATDTPAKLEDFVGLVIVVQFRYGVRLRIDV